MSIINLQKIAHSLNSVEIKSNLAYCNHCDKNHVLMLFSLVCGEHGHWSAVVCGGLR